MNIQGLIDTKLSQKEKRKPSGKINAHILGQCHRRQYWYLNGEPPTNPPDERSLRIFACGDLFHQFVQDILKENGYELEVEYKDDDVSIRCDAVNETEVVEIKSQHSRAFWWMDKEQKNGKLLYEIKPEVILQASLGAYKLKKKFMRIVFISKDDLCIKEYLYPFKKETEERLLKEISKIKEMLAKKETPPPQPRLYSKEKECQYCNWKDKCKEEKNVKS